MNNQPISFKSSEFSKCVQTFSKSYSFWSFNTVGLREGFYLLSYRAGDFQVSSNDHKSLHTITIPSFSFENYDFSKSVKSMVLPVSSQWNCERWIRKPLCEAYLCYSTLICYPFTTGMDDFPSFQQRNISTER